MPFIEQKRRGPLTNGTLTPDVPGDLAYLVYRKYIQAWKAERRWTTAHNLYRDYCTYPATAPYIAELEQEIPMHLDRQDVFAAARLAFFVFFTFHVLPYEIWKLIVNGKVD